MGLAALRCLGVRQCHCALGAALVGTSSDLLLADLLIRDGVELNVVPLNMSSTSGKAMLDQVGAQMQEVDSLKCLDFKLIAEKFARGEPLQCETGEDEGEEDNEPGIVVRVLHLLLLELPHFSRLTNWFSMDCQGPDKVGSLGCEATSLWGSQSSFVGATMGLACTIRISTATLPCYIRPLYCNFFHAATPKKQETPSKKNPTATAKMAKKPEAKAETKPAEKAGRKRKGDEVANVP